MGNSFSCPLNVEEPYLYFQQTRWPKLLICITVLAGWFLGLEWRIISVSAPECTCWHTAHEPWRMLQFLNPLFSASICILRWCDLSDLSSPGENLNLGAVETICGCLRSLFYVVAGHPFCLRQSVVWGVFILGTMICYSTAASQHRCLDFLPGRLF